ncbi:MAG: helix-turn-helix domain-containing protein [Lachnospiraceae bacterium]|nr:helix-turn-helix domain-containing protein [Lachnospiraceae bacterium]
MNTNKDLNYRLYLQELDGFIRTPFHSEFEKYMVIQSGDVEKVKENFAKIRPDFMKGKGKLSEDPVRNIMYHFVTAVALTSRICVEGGLSHDAAYTLSDIYIQKADKCKSPELIIDMFEEMQVDFASRMRDLKKDKVTSLHVRKCIDYIYEHLQEKLSLKFLADRFHLNASYLSKLFQKETGVSFKDFVTEAKVSTAENMLKYSDHSHSDIALALGFSSQSAFISVFKKSRGITPQKYREKYYRNDIGQKYEKQ